MTLPSAGGRSGTIAPQPQRHDDGTDEARIAFDDRSPLIRSARAFAARAHARQRRESDGAPFIEHPLQVARLLSAEGCPAVVVAAALLHDVLEDTAVTDRELVACFGADVAALVRAVSEDPCIPSYRERKLRLREQVRRIGGDAALLFAADKISKVRELRSAPAPESHGGARIASRREHTRRMRMEHYEESLEMLRSVVPHHPLVHALAVALGADPVG